MYPILLSPIDKSSPHRYKYTRKRLLPPWLVFKVMVTRLGHDLGAILSVAQRFLPDRFSGSPARLILMHVSVVDL